MILNFGNKPLEKRVKSDIDDVTQKGETAAFWHNLSVENWHDLSATLDEIYDEQLPGASAEYAATVADMKREDDTQDRTLAEIDEHRENIRRLKGLLHDPKRMKRLLQIVRQWKKEHSSEA